MKNTFVDQTELDLDFQFTFGKYKYATVLHVLEIDPEYLKWFASNVEGYDLADDVEEAVEDEAFRLELLATN